MIHPFREEQQVERGGLVAPWKLIVKQKEIGYNVENGSMMLEG